MDEYEIAEGWYRRASDGRLPFQWIVRAERDIVEMYWRERYGDEPFEPVWEAATQKAASALMMERLFWLYCHAVRCGRLGDANEAANDIIRCENENNISFLTNYVEVRV